MKEMRKIIYGNHDIYADFQPLEIDLQGWTSDSPIFDFVIQNFKPQRIIEVGSWKGRSAINMAKICKRLGLNTEILCIDTWLGSVEHWTHEDENLPISKFKNGKPTIYDQFISNVIHTETTEYITPFPIDSINGALVLKKYGIQADFIYIDAGHEYDSVKNDLTNYSKLVKQGGILVGDDWFHPPIKQAVADTLGRVATFSNDKFMWTISQQ
jgi:cephalosporin hydroxylase